MKLVLSLLLCLTSTCAWGLELEYLNQVTLPHKMKFKKSVIGGLSGLYYESGSENLFSISDDRGNVNEPRFYQFRLVATAKEFKVEPQEVTFLSVNPTEYSHSKVRKKASLFSQVLDLEAISKTPWGDFLIANEGDMNRKPRVRPQILDVKPDGTITREFEVPDDFLPEPAGEQKKGVQNNLAFEGLTASPNGKEWMVSTEAPLKQDPKTFVRFIQYGMTDAFVIKPQKQFRYPFTPEKDDSKGLRLQKGISEIQYLDEHHLLVLERSVFVSSGGVKFQIQIFESDLQQTDKDQMLGRQMVLDLDSVAPKFGGLDNFEGMTLGPKLSDGRRTLILVSDDNFMRKQKTQFLLFAIKE